MKTIRNHREPIGNIYDDHRKNIGKESIGKPLGHKGTQYKTIGPPPDNHRKPVIVVAVAVVVAVDPFFIKGRCKFFCCTTYR